MFKYSLLLLLAFVAPGIQARCHPEIVHFEVWDGDARIPVPGDNSIDENYASVCMPQSGKVNIQAVTSWCTFKTTMELIRPNGRSINGTSDQQPFFLINNRGKNVRGRVNFLPYKWHTISATPYGDGTVGEEVSFFFYFKNCDAYDIHLDLFGLPDQDMGHFVASKMKWESVITEGTPSIAGSALASAPPIFEECEGYPDEIDDLYICAGYGHIDGPGKILGWAGVHWYWLSGQALTGYMFFESVDAIAYGDHMETIVKHEMGHVIGIGTLWEFNGIAGPDSEDCPYSGAAANGAYSLISGNSCPVPTELDGGGGTRCGHWDESCLQSELMTGYLSADVQHLSMITIGSLQDMGYSVDIYQADLFDAEDLGSCPCDGEARALNEEKTRRKLSRKLMDAVHEKASTVFAAQEVPNDIPTGLGFKNAAVFVVEEDGELYSVVVKEDE